MGYSRKNPNPWIFHQIVLDIDRSLPFLEIQPKTKTPLEIPHYFFGAITLSYPPTVIDDSSWKNPAQSFTVALTLTLTP